MLTVASWKQNAVCHYVDSSARQYTSLACCSVKQCSFASQSSVYSSTIHRQEDNIKCFITDIKDISARIPAVSMTATVWTLTLINDDMAVDMGQSNACKCPLN
jgi:hypothetical protein